jgi:hypothetical protein
MVEIKHYGVTSEELDAESVLECRQIVKTINQYGVSDKQKLKIIYLLSLELENRDHLQELSSLIKRLEAGERRSTLITEVG